MENTDNSRNDGYQQPYRYPRLTIAIIIINVLVFLYTDLFAFSANGDIIQRGGESWYGVIVQGEWYRLVTAMFLHSSMQHLGNNMLLLYCMGYYLERELGSIRYGILYFGSGFLAGGASMVYNMLKQDYTISIGASGAIFGIVGAMLFLVLFFKRRAFQYSLRQIIFLVFLSLYSGFVSQGVDNAAHVGGFAGGFLLMALLSIGLHRKRIC